MEDSEGSNLQCRGRLSSLLPKLSLLVECTSVIFKKREDHLSSMHQEEKKRKRKKGKSLSPQCITMRKSVPLNEVSMMEIEADLGGAFHCFGIF